LIDVTALAAPTGELLLAQVRSYWLLQHGPLALFVFCLGACVGSFINVVIYRLPEGMSVIRPPSRCPRCGERLRFFRDNLPIIGWLVVRGRCRYCKAPVSAQYMIVELLMALLFLYLYLCLYTASPHVAWWGEIGAPWWYYNQLIGSWGLGQFGTWPAFIALIFMVAGLVAMTVIDARTFTIPMAIPLFVTVTAFVAYAIQGVLPGRTVEAMSWPIPAMGWRGTLAAIGGMAGVAISMLLLRAKVLSYSFADYDDYVEEGQTLAEYPHARREMRHELVFLAPCVILIAVGAWLGARLPQEGSVPPVVLQALGASFMGYLVGGGVVWAIRILGTFAFGREAMGLGDVHLLAAVGAVLGWFDPILVFFLAPFFGLFWTLMSKGFSVVLKRTYHPLPYGPHLALATMVIVLCRPGIDRAWSGLFEQVPRPSAGLVAPPEPRSSPAP
jgi:leader peptidase (prepilin peptidase)/N-methyltransferase